mmetsp:Transcript_27198/g.40149  ORF Transcript_27198/g.40149 Transcript_27198/m.40149 type:complete len:87 (+) Transcript_27198:647-907(+)
MRITKRQFCLDSVRYPLLFGPQTAKLCGMVQTITIMRQRRQRAMYAVAPVESESLLIVVVMIHSCNDLYFIMTTTPYFPSVLILIL